MEAGRESPLPRPWHCFAAIVGLSALASFLAASLFSAVGHRQRQAEMGELAFLAQFKAEQMEAWLANRRRAIEKFVADPRLQQDIHRYLESRDPVLGERLKNRIQAGSAAEDSIGIELIDGRHRPALGLGKALLDAAPIQAGLRSGGLPRRATLVDMHRDRPDGEVYFGLEIALSRGTAEEAPRRAYLRFNFDLRQTMARSLQQWPLAESSGEIVLLRHEGDEVVNLSPMRHPPNVPLAFRLPLAAPDQPILHALLQSDGTYEGPDWRQVEVLAAARGIADTPWTVMVKKDRAEILENLSTLYRLAVGIILAAVLGTSLLLWYFWRRQSRQALAIQLVDLAATVPGVLFSFHQRADGSSHFPYASPAIEGLYGLTPAQLRDDGAPALDRVHPQDLERVQDSVAQSARNLTLWQCEFRVRHPERGEIWLEGCSTPRREADGTTLWHGFLHDITARRAVEHALLDANERWRRLVEAMPQLIWACHDGGTCQYVNPPWLAYTGRPASGHLGQGWQEFVHPDDRSRLGSALSQALADNKVMGGEFRLRRADGEYHWFKTHMVPVGGPVPRDSICYGFNTDIQEFKEIQSALQCSLFRQQALQQLDRAILESSTPEEVASRCLDHLVSLLHCRGADAITFDLEAGEARVLAQQHQDGFQSVPGRQISLASYGREDLAALEDGRCCLVTDLAAFPDRALFLEALHQQGIRSYVRIPLSVEGRLLGALDLFSDRAGFFSQADVEAALPIADVLAIALQQAILRQRLIEQTATLEIRVAQRTAELERTKDQAEAASRAKSRFLANISHELRTPLNSLLILSELLADNTEGNLTPEQMEFARVIHNAGSDLLNLINDILDISKIESGRAAVYSGTVSFEEVRGYLDRLFRRAAESKSLSFEMEVSADLPDALHTDIHHLKPILRNLVANAIKFTNAGSVVLKVRPAASGWSAGHPVLSRADTVVAFDVADTGIGIAADKLPLIFELFEQTQTHATRHYGGTGLGLHIARINAELLGGELAAASIPGEGSTFTIYLPLMYMAPAGAARPPAD